MFSSSLVIKGNLNVWNCWSFSKYSLVDKLKKNTLNLMERRGPDFKQSLDFNYNNKLFTTLFHSRLSIIDLP